jgi:adenylate cyclase
MDKQDRIEDWLVQAGLVGTSETESLHGFCDRCCGAGIGLSRAMLLVDTLHPIHEGRAFRWRVDSIEQPAVVEYGSSNVGETAANWRASPFYRLVTTGESELRRRIDAGAAEEFAIFREMKAEGQTDYVAFVHRFGTASIFGERWTACTRPGPRGGQAGLMRRISLRCDDSFHSWHLPSNASRWHASRGRLSRCILATMRARGC